jgi:hypothetical protein
LRLRGVETALLFYQQTTNQYVFSFKPSNMAHSVSPSYQHQFAKAT